MRQIDVNVDQLAMFPVILDSDPYVRDYMDGHYKTIFDIASAEARIAEKMSLQSVSSNWVNELSLYLPHERKVISSSIFAAYDETSLRARLSRVWTYEAMEQKGQSQKERFYRQIITPAKATSLDQSSSIMEVSFPVENIKVMLDQFKSGGHGDPFLYRPGLTPIYNSSSSRPLVAELLGKLPASLDGDSGRLLVKLERQQYVVHYVKSKQLGWDLVDYVPQQQIVRPITASRNLFYGSIGLLLALSVLAAALLYRNVQIPIRKLMHGVQLLKKGDFSARIQYKADNEFDFLVRRFNEMAEETQQLIETVFMERIRLREATLKQLQAQINPHFLYNSLFFIVNTAKLGDQEAVVAMAQNLGDYYRYTTRVENQLVPVREELNVVRNYLIIQNLRMQRLYYEIEVSEPLASQPIPRLLLQPIVENAIVHGLERQAGDGVIVISGTVTGGECRVEIADNGVGLPADRLAELERQIELPMEEKMGCGLWNVHQRLKYQFGEDAGVELRQAPGGGLCVALHWPLPSSLEAVAADEEMAGQRGSEE
jgi:two-component system sensor histidine kinase YesM